MQLYLIIIAGFILISLEVYYLFNKKVRKVVLGADSEELFSQKILEAIPDLIVLVNKDFIIQQIANVSDSNTSFPYKMRVGAHVLETLDLSAYPHLSASDPDTEIPILKGIQQALTTDKIVETEYSVVIHGKVMHFEGRYKRLNKNLVICIERNTTERKQAEALVQQKEMLFSEIINNMPIPLVIKDINNNLKYVYWNNASEKSGLKKEDVLGRNDVEIYGKQRGNKYYKLDMEAIQNADAIQFEDSYERPDGIKHTSIVFKKVVSNEINNWLLTFRWDVTYLKQIQEELQEANEQLHMALSISSSVPLVWDLETDTFRLKFPEFKEKNEGFVMNQQRVSTAEIIANIHPDERKQIAADIKAMKEGVTNNAHRIVRYDVAGNYRSFYEVFISVSKRNEQGLPLQAVGNLRNITRECLHEIKLKEANERISNIQRINQIILDNANSGLVYLSPDYEIRWENIKYYCRQNFAQRYKIGAICYKEVRGRDIPCSECMATKALKNKRVEIQEITFDDGYTMSITATPVFNTDGSNQGVVLKFDDITAQRKAAEELRKAKEAAEASDKLKSKFISNMSHEIRTPLNAIIGFSELLMGAKTQEEKEDFMNVIKNNNEQLLKLINDMLDLSKIEANILEFVYSDVDINELIKQIEFSSNKKIEKGRNLTVTFEPPQEMCIIHTEKNRFFQIVSNLVSNALKFTREGSIKIGYEVLDGKIKVYVSDTGIGIPKEKLSTIFHRFVKLDNFIPGTGLGLPICQSLVKKLGGEIGVESERGKGSTFWFTLPGRPLTMEEFTERVLSGYKLEPTAQLFDKEKPVILVAEDSPDNFRLFKLFLEDDYTILHAWDGKEALDVYTNEKDAIDLVLMDIRMPEMSGVEVASAIRSMNNKVPLIAVSAYAFPEDIETIISSGFNGYISKPVSKEELLTSISNLKMIDAPEV